MSGNYVIKITDRNLATGTVLCCCCCLVAKSFLALETPWAVTHQVPLSMGFSRQEYWCEQPFPSPGYLPGPGIEPRSPALEVDFLLSEPPGNITFSVSNLRLNIPTPVFLPGKSYAEDSGWLWSMGLQRVGHNLVTEHMSILKQLMVHRPVFQGIYS